MVSKTTVLTTAAAAAILALAACSGGGDEGADAAQFAEDLANAQVLIGDLEAQAQGLTQELAAAKAAPQVDLTTGIDAAPDARADIVNTRGETVGEAMLWEASGGVLMRLAITALETNGAFHGLHFHAVGLCEGEDGFTSAAGHIMPTGLPHGYLNPEGPHEGNLPNVYIHNPQSAFGFGVTEIYTTLVTMDDGPAGLLDADGSTLIIHEQTDDHFTQPIGGAGARIGCGVVEPVSG